MEVQKYENCMVLTPFLARMKVEPSGASACITKEPGSSSWKFCSATSMTTKKNASTPLMFSVRDYAFNVFPDGRMSLVRTFLGFSVELYNAGDSESKHQYPSLLSGSQEAARKC